MRIINTIFHSMDYCLQSSLDHVLAKKLPYSSFQKDSTFDIIIFTLETSLFFFVDS